MKPLLEASMKPLLWVPTLLMLLGCSGRTVTEVNVDGVSLLKATGEELKVQLQAGLSGNIFIPGEPPGSGQTIPLPKLDVIESSNTQLEVQLTGGSSGTPNTVGVEVRLAPSNDSGTMFDDQGGDLSLISQASTTTTVAAGQTKTIAVNLNLPSDNPAALSIIKGGDFKFALRASATGGNQITFELTKLNLSVRGKLFRLIPAQ
jgi:hypothetical protein